MDDIRKCALCGAELPPASDRSHCLGCLLQLGLASKSSSGNSPADVSITEVSGDWIGRYKLVQQIGEGGCGVVYRAEQETPVRRVVALKIVKLGMDTKTVIARFAAERQALAMMDHPNIAKVFDAGATETGRPYFVMELVEGRKITQYCDQHGLSTNQRLALFVQVCAAIQHAHQKGVIHRDIKPSNILVTEENGKPAPKVIDFGIAKATTDQTLTDKTLYTAFEQFLGTPAYMSPEQAGMGEMDIDTRTDIYSLGALLYEILTGEPPFSNEEFARGALDETLQTIRRKEPQLPSSRVANLDPRQLAVMGEQRQSDASKLSKLLRGELDWIVMKALEKDRNRRYETANGFALDVQRLLDNEPVAARPPSQWYRFQKMASRNKAVFSILGAAGLILTMAAIVSSVLLFREQSARRREIVAVESRAQTEHITRNLIFGEDDFESASEQGKSNQYTVAESNSRKKIQLRQKMFGTNDVLVERALRDLVWSLTSQNRFADAERNARLVLSMDTQTVSNKALQGDKETLLAILYQEGKLQEADQLYRTSSNQIGEKLSLFAIASLLWDEGKYEEARAARLSAILYDQKHSATERRGPQFPLSNPTNTTAALHNIPGWGMAEIIDPDRDCIIKTEPANISISLPAALHTLGEPSEWSGYYLEEDGNYKNYDPPNNAPRILKNVRGDFTVQVAVSGTKNPPPMTNATNAEADSPYTYQPNSAGLMLRDTDAHAILFECEGFTSTNFLPKWQQPATSQKFRYLKDWNNQIQREGYSIHPLFRIMNWLRIVRKGNHFTAFISDNGVEWIEADALNAEFPPAMEVGIVARGRSHEAFTANFSNFTIISNMPSITVQPSSGK